MSGRVSLTRVHHADMLDPRKRNLEETGRSRRETQANARSLLALPPGYETLEQRKRSDSLEPLQSPPSLTIFINLLFNVQVPHSYREVLDTLVNGLQRLEYRGYDSAGIAVDWPTVPSSSAPGPRATVIKTTGKVSALRSLASKRAEELAVPLDVRRTAGSGIAHTRWATHGPPSSTNAHPHVSGPDGQFVVVHNGTITNYRALRNFLAAKGRTFESDTDTEVIPKLLAYLAETLPDLTFPELVCEATKQLEGSYALLIKSTLFPDELAACRKGSPLIVGVSHGPPPTPASRDVGVGPAPTPRSGLTPRIIGGASAPVAAATPRQRAKPTPRMNVTVSVSNLGVGAGSAAPSPAGDSLPNASSPSGRRPPIVAGSHSLPSPSPNHVRACPSPSGAASAATNPRSLMLSSMNAVGKPSSHPLQLYLASEASAVVEHTRQVIYLEDNDILHAVGGAYAIYNCADASAPSIEVSRAAQTLTMEVSQIMKGGYQHFMEKEIFEQPETLRATMQGRVPSADGDEDEQDALALAKGLASKLAMVSPEPSADQAVSVDVVIATANSDEDAMLGTTIALDEGDDDAVELADRSAETKIKAAGGLDALPRTSAESLLKSTSAAATSHKVPLSAKAKLPSLKAALDAKLSAIASVSATVSSSSLVFPPTTEVHLGGLMDALPSLRRSRRILLVGCGTSYHAALAARQTLEEMSDAAVVPELASDLLDRRCPIFRDDACLFVSQSGETADTMRALEYAKARGALCVGVTNVVGSAVDRGTDAGVHINAGAEIGVASTKAYTSQVVALTLVALALGGDRASLAPRRAEILEGLRELPANVKRTLALNEEVKALAKSLADEPSLLVFGRGRDHATALEAALKVKEVAYMHSEGINAGEMKHGPLALVDESLPLLVVAPQGPMHYKMMGVIQQLQARRARLLVLGTEGDDELDALAVEAEQHGRPLQALRVPKVDEALQPIVDIVPLQLLAYHLTVLRGYDVDQPRNLAKSVTVSEE